MQDAGAGPGPGGDFGGRAGGVEPQGQGGVPQVAGAAGGRGGGQGGAEGGLAGGVPGAAVETESLSMPPRAPRNSRPSGAVPNARRCWPSMRTRTGGMGTTRTAPPGRCLRPRGSNGVPVLVQAAPVRGQAAVTERRSLACHIRRHRYAR